MHCDVGYSVCCGVGCVDCVCCRVCCGVTYGVCCGAGHSVLWRWS